MKRSLVLLATAVLLLALVGLAQASTYHVGSGQTYATLQDLLSAVTLGDNDVALVHPGTYGPIAIYSGGGSSEATAAVIRAYDMNNKPVFDAAGADNCFKVEAGSDTWYYLDGLEIANAAFRGVFHVGGGLIMRNCYVHDCENGIMSGMYNTRDESPGYLIVEHCEIAYCGAGTQRHSFYLQEYWCEIRYNWIHDPAGGIGFKDRSRDSLLEYNLIEGGPGGAGCAISFCGWDDSGMPDVGQRAWMIGNIVTKNGGGNRWLFLNNIRVADGGVSGHTNPGRLYLYNNTFYTEDHSGPMFADDELSVLEAHNNIWHSTTCDRVYDQVDAAGGPGQVLTSYNNWVENGISVPSGFTDTVFGSDPGCVNVAWSGGDWHLTSGSPCRDAGRAGLAVVPTKEYAHPCDFTPRPADGSIDIGAYEYSTGGSLPPVALFEADPTSGNMPLSVDFTDLSANTPTSWDWDFGDSATSTAQHPSHTYPNPGYYTVSLTVYNSLGSDNRTQVDYINVIDSNSPVADFTVNTRMGGVPMSVDFTDASSNSPTSWDWVFGDGGTSTAQDPSHTYTSEGMYTVSLTAANSYGYDTETKTDFVAACVEVVVYPASWGNQIWTAYDVTILSGGLSDLQTSNDVYMDMECDTSNQNYTVIYEALCGYTASQIYGIVYEYEGHSSRNDTPDGTLMHIRGWDGEYVLLDPDGVQWTTTDEWWTFETTSPTSWVEGDGTIGFGMCGCPANSSNYSMVSDVMRFRLYLKPGQAPQPPLANFSGNPTTGDAPLTVSFSDLSTNSPTSWSWDFGDTGSSTAQNPSHDYTSAGDYTVSLTATNAAGSDAETKTDYISVSTPPPAPVAEFSGSPTSGDYPLTVNFTDLSTNTPTSWSWDFGDTGTSTAQNPSHDYTNAGDYTVSLTATNAGGSDSETKTDYISVSTPPPPAPVAEFSGSPTSGQVTLTVNFTDLSTNTPTSWSWDFGDTGTSTAQNPSHDYASVGDYTVSLTATNASGSDIETKVDYISVYAVPPPAPVAEFSGSPLSGDATLTVNFTDLSTNTPTSWSWDFGDSGTSTAQNPSHDYTSAGDYTVSLTATNAGGSDIETKVDYISVTTPPPPAPARSPAPLPAMPPSSLAPTACSSPPPTKCSTSTTPSPSSPPSPAKP